MRVIDTDFFKVKIIHEKDYKVEGKEIKNFSDTVKSPTYSTMDYISLLNQYKDDIIVLSILPYIEAKELKDSFRKTKIYPFYRGYGTIYKKDFGNLLAVNLKDSVLVNADKKNGNWIIKETITYKGLGLELFTDFFRREAENPFFTSASTEKVLGYIEKGKANLGGNEINLERYTKKAGQDFTKEIKKYAKNIPEDIIISCSIPNAVDLSQFTNPIPATFDEEAEGLYEYYVERRD